MFLEITFTPSSLKYPESMTVQMFLVSKVSFSFSLALAKRNFPFSVGECENSVVHMHHSAQ